MKKMSTVVALLVLALAFGACAQKKGSGSSSAGLKPVYFDFDKSDITSSSEATLKDNAAWLKKNSKKSVTVEGYCDERGSFEYNIALGDRRATAAQSYLKNLGVDGKRLSTVSYGEDKPVASCHDESCWAKNRRAEFVTK